MKRATREFFTTDPVTLARRLVGATLHRKLPDGTHLAGIIVEVEAYLGAEDRCCHSFGNKRTTRNNSMFLAPGTAYVYFTYGMHHCFNVVCGTAEDPHEPVAVLIRALEPIAGLERMRELRGRAGKRDRDLCSGPGKLCQAMAMDKEQDGIDMTTSKSLWISPAERLIKKLTKSPRIGVSGAKGNDGISKQRDRTKWIEAPLRWYDPGRTLHVSIIAKKPKSNPV